VFRTAQHLEDDLGCGVDVQLTLDRSVFHGVPLSATFGCR
jgi:hypothetical protein